MSKAVVGAVGFAAGSAVARKGAVAPLEQRAFRAVNQLPERLFPPVWAVMQLGSFGGILAASATALVAKRESLAPRLLVAGSTTWLTAKAAKQLVRRGRPSTTLDEWRALGRAQSGLGYPSGHAGVAVALAAVAATTVGRRWHPALWAASGVVGAGRIYCGAHLPLDVAGGAALGYAIGTGVNLAAR